MDQFWINPCMYCNFQMDIYFRRLVFNKGNAGVLNYIQRLFAIIFTVSKLKIVIKKF